MKCDKLPNQHSFRLTDGYLEENSGFAHLTYPRSTFLHVTRILFYGIDQNIISHQHRSPSKSPETTGNARAAHIPYTLAALPAASGLPARF